MDYEDKQFNIKYKGNKYNIYKFLNNHPGGINYIYTYKDKEISKQMKDIPHSKLAYYLLRDYKINGHDKDLEELVDWNKPMLYQVGKLKTNYHKWVISPVDRKLRLFDNPLLEYLTITPWYVVPLVWIPIIIYIINYGMKKYNQIMNVTSCYLQLVLCLILGIFLWTLIEYCLHRWVFHIEPTGKSKFIIYFHFAIHGLHHKVPFDSKRLVFPPFPAAIIAYSMYFIFTFILPESIILLVIAGGLIGYLTYDMIHFYLHYGSPKENSYLYILKRCHNQHHFAHHNSGFGISSLIWDEVFGTAIKLKRLSIGIKW